MTLKWLISPVKVASRPRILRGQAGSRFKEIEIKFDKLHQEYCLSPGKQLSLTYPSGSAVDVYRGGPTSPGSPQGLEAHLDGWDGGAEERSRREGIYVCIWLIYFIIQQKRMQHFKAIILQ